MYAPHRALTRRRGFTLLELTLVMAIILIVGALATPLIFQNTYTDAKVNAAADLVRARMLDARTQAIEESRSYAFYIVPGTSKFKIEPLDYNGNADGSDNGLVIEDKLPGGVRFTEDGSTGQGSINDDDEPAGGDYVLVAVFLSDGCAQDDVQITFGGKGVSAVQLQLRSVTGIATVVRPQPDGGQ
jgi:prepilin-type N-terminal cleavage/methylation domain-containing protein